MLGTDCGGTCPRRAVRCGGCAGGVHAGWRNLARDQAVRTATSALLQRACDFHPYWQPRKVHFATAPTGRPISPVDGGPTCCFAHSLGTRLVKQSCMHRVHACAWICYFLESPVVRRHKKVASHRQSHGQSCNITHPFTARTALLHARASDPAADLLSSSPPLLDGHWQPHTLRSGASSRGREISRGRLRCSAGAGPCVCHVQRNAHPRVSRGCKGPVLYRSSPNLSATGRLVSKELVQPPIVGRAGGWGTQAISEV